MRKPACLGLYAIMFLLFSVLIPGKVLAQKKVINDPSYYETLPEKLTGRVYLAQKFLKFTIPSSSSLADIEYKANTKLNLGVGVTYHNFSINVFYGFAFLNRDTAKGTTKGLDLQLHLYPRKWAIDLLVLLPKGYHLEPKGFATTPNKYYYRKDVELKLLGISAYQVPNKEKFSYRAAITQNEWQKKSAGSPLYGGILYYGTVRGDSALVPKIIEANFPQKGITNLNFMAIGAGVGYAYTLVMDQHFFITASAVGNLDLTFTSEDAGSVKKRKTSVGPSVVAKGAVGYNSADWSVSVNGLGSAFWTKGAASPKNYYLPTGSIRLAVSKKFNVKKHSDKK
ncbi:MAG: DUF4421 domain-containing protein [Chitinophagaceae bacterium]